MILAGQLAAPEDVQRFRREAEAAANLDHPHIVSIYEVGEHQGQHYFSMRLIEGGSLGECMERFRGDMRAAARLLATVARAVHYAHQRGLLHRDLKPANILLDAKGEPHVTDFGLAKRVEGGGNLTQSGAIVGTPSYMAPEQARAERGLSTAVDVYSLGAILYEVLTGQPPFRAATPLDTVLQVLEREPVPPRKVDPRVDRDLETICLKCLEKNPSKRYGSAEALAEDLERHLQGEPILARPAGRAERMLKWARRRPAVAGLLTAVVLVAAAGLGGILWTYGEAVWQRDRARDEKDRADREAKFAVIEAENAKSEKHRADGEAEKARQQKKVADDAARRADDKTADALREAKKAQQKEEEAKSARNDARRQTYWAKIGQVDAQLLAGEYQAAVDVLNGIAPEERGWEYYHLRRRANGTPLTLQVSNGWVSCICYSPDGRYLAGAAGNEIKVWDTRTGTNTITFRGHTGLITAVVYSPDGTHIASVGGDVNKPGEVKLWDARGGAEPLTLRGHIGRVTVVAYSPDRARLATGSDDGTVKIWHAHSGAVIATLHGHTWGPNQARPAAGPPPAGSPPLELPPPITALAFSPDGKRLASASWGDSVKVWDATSGADLPTLRGHTSTVHAVAYSPDGTQLASAAATLSPESGEVKLWDAKSNSEITTLRGHTAAVSAMAYSPDGTRIATASNGTVKVWDTRSGVQVASLPVVHHFLTTVVFSPDGKCLASASGLEVKLWDVRSGTNIITLHGTGGPVAYSPDGTRIATNSGDTVKVWNATSDNEIATLRGHTGWVRSVCYSPAGTRMASASAVRDNTVKLWDPRSGAELATLRGHRNWVWFVAYSPDGTRLASASADQTVKVWDAQSGAEIVTLRGHTSLVYSVAYSPDGSCLASASDDRTIKIWDGRSGALLHTLPGHTGSVYSVAYSRDGTRLASASAGKQPFDPGEVKIWDTAKGIPIATLAGHAAQVLSVAFSPDGTRLASASTDSTIRVWDVRRAVPIATLRGHTSGVFCVCYSPDGTRLASASGLFDKTVKVWDTQSNSLVLTLRGHTDEVAAVCFSPDGTRLASASHDQTIKIWDTRTGAQAGELPHARAYDAWAEDLYCHTSVAPAWHAESAHAAEAQGDWFAAAFHRRLLASRWQVGDPWHLRCLAWDELAGGDNKSYRQTCRRLCEASADGSDLRPLFRLSTAFACLPTGSTALTGPVAVEKALQQTALQRPALAVRAAALSADNGVQPGELLALARTALHADLSPWEGQELLGAALYRAGQPAHALRELHKAVELHGAGGSTWARMFLALVYRRLDQDDEAAGWRDKAVLPKDADWRERLIHRQLSREFDEKK
jgi:WD40 repeat protein